MAVVGKLPAVPETILKRSKWQAENPDLRAKKAVKSKVVFKIKKVIVNVFQIFTVQAARKAKRADIVKHGKKFAKEYQDQENDEIRHTLYRCHWAENYIYISQNPYLKSYCNKESNIK